MEFRVAQAQDEKATPGFGVESDLGPCPRYSQVSSVSTVRSKNANAQNGTQTLTESLEILHNPRTSLGLCALIPEYWGETTTWNRGGGCCPVMGWTVKLG